MGFFDTVKDRAGALAADAGRASKVTAAQTRLVVLQNDLRKAERAFGQEAFALVERGELEHPELAGALARLRATTAEVHAKEAEIAALRGAAPDEPAGAEAPTAAPPPSVTVADAPEPVVPEQPVVAPAQPVVVSPSGSPSSRRSRRRRPRASPRPSRRGRRYRPRGPRPRSLRRASRRLPRRRPRRRRPPPRSGPARPEAAPARPRARRRRSRGARRRPAPGRRARTSRRAADRRRRRARSGALDNVNRADVVPRPGRLVPCPGPRRLP